MRLINMLMCLIPTTFCSVDVDRKCVEESCISLGLKISQDSMMRKKGIEEMG